MADLLPHLAFYKNSTKAPKCIICRHRHFGGEACQSYNYITENVCMCIKGQLRSSLFADVEKARETEAAAKEQAAYIVVKDKEDNALDIARRRHGALVWTCTLCGQTKNIVVDKWDRCLTCNRPKLKQSLPNTSPGESTKGKASTSASVDPTANKERTHLRILYSLGDRTHPFYLVINTMAPVPVHIEGQRWHTVEHFYQYHKFAGTDVGEILKGGRYTGDSKRFQMNNGYIRCGHEAHALAESMDAIRHERTRTQKWKSKNEGTMFKALRAKFIQHPKLRKMLAETGEAMLVCRGKHPYWCDGNEQHRSAKSDIRGQNKHAAILMQIRRELKYSGIERARVFQFM